MLLVIAYSQAARRTLRNVCRAHEETVVAQFGRGALLDETGLGAFHALRLREKYGLDVQVERTYPLNEFEEIPEDIRAAVEAYEARESPNTPYEKFAARTDHPSPEELRAREL